MYKRQTHDSATQVHGAVEEARKASFAMEIPSVLYMLAQFVVNKLTGVAVCAAAIVFYFSGTMELTNCPVSYTHLERIKRMMYGRYPPIMARTML